MLSFVGLGLWDERSVTVRGQEAIRGADTVFGELYTSRLPGVSVEALERYHDTTIRVRDRAGVEGEPSPILEAGASGTAVFVTAGDPMISTTHVDLRVRAMDHGVETRVVHAPSAQSAASGLTGLQNYRFGKATTIPFAESHGGTGLPESVVETIEGNRDRELHTLAYLDIRASEERYMTADTGASRLVAAGVSGVGVAVCRAGSENPVVVADTLEALAGQSFGDPLHLLVLPGTVHDVEAEALQLFAGADPALLDA